MLHETRAESHREANVAWPFKYLAHGTFGSQAKLDIQLMGQLDSKLEQADIKELQLAIEGQRMPVDVPSMHSSLKGLCSMTYHIAIVQLWYTLVNIQLNGMTVANKLDCIQHDTACTSDKYLFVMVPYAVAERQSLLFHLVGTQQHAKQHLGGLACLPYVCV